MPKGVEHSATFAKKFALLCVESLMPKGVEHISVLGAERYVELVSNL